jgi:hypothetical protein
VCAEVCYWDEGTELRDALDVLALPRIDGNDVEYWACEKRQLLTAPLPRLQWSVHASPRWYRDLLSSHPNLALALAILSK